jgi:hypothetical protein
MPAASAGSLPPRPSCFPEVVEYGKPSILAESSFFQAPSYPFFVSDFAIQLLDLVIAKDSHHPYFRDVLCALTAYLLVHLLVGECELTVSASCHEKRGRNE